MRTVEIPEVDRRELQRRSRSKGAPARVVERARIVLLAAEGMPGAVLDTMARGLIPVVNRESGIDHEDFGVLLENSSIAEYCGEPGPK